MKKRLNPGDKINDYTIIECIYDKEKNMHHYLCECKCGFRLKTRIYDIERYESCRNCRAEKLKKFKNGDFINNCEIIGYDKDKWKYIFKCYCGKEFKKGTYPIKNGAYICCKSCYKKELLVSDKKTRADKISLKRKDYSTYIDSCKRRSYEWLLSLDEFINLTDDNCFYCGGEPYREIKGNSKVNPLSIFSNGIDRVDNTKGYSVENCVSCCEICNKAKRMLSIEEFEDWVNRISNNLKNNGSFVERFVNNS